MECAGRGGAGQAGVVMKSSPSHAGHEEAGRPLPEPRRHPDWPAQRASLLPSPLGGGTEGRAGARAGPGPRAQGSSSDLVGQTRAGGSPCRSFDTTEGSSSDQFQENKESLTPRAPFCPKRSQTPGKPPPPGKQATPSMGSACTRTRKEANQVKHWRWAQPGGKSISSHTPGGGVSPSSKSPRGPACRPSPRTLSLTCLL